VVCRATTWAWQLLLFKSLLLLPSFLLLPPASLPHLSPHLHGPLPFTALAWGWNNLTPRASVTYSRGNLYTFIPLTC